MTGYSGVEFDHGAFYEWAERQSEPVIISEYAMPEDRFERIDCIRKRNILAGSTSVIFKDEGLFVPKVQIEKGIFKLRKEWRQQEFF